MPESMQEQLARTRLYILCYKLDLVILKDLKVCRKVCKEKLSQKCILLGKCIKYF